VDQLLALAHADRPAARARFEDLDLASVVREVLKALQPASERLGARLEARLDPLPLHGDPGLLAVMVRNLLDNALRYGPQGGTVRITTGGNALVVEDQGPGIPPDERRRVFERFYRLAGSRASGSGLGLSIVQRIVELHDGQIDIDSTADGGTRMCATFPTSPAS
jgi:signal transduction histidine kinase